MNITDIYNSTCLNYTNSSVIPNITSTGQVSWLLSELNLGVGSSYLLSVNFTALAACVNTPNQAFVNVSNGTIFNATDSAILNITTPQVDLIANVLSPPNASTVLIQSVTLNFSTNIDAVCKVHLWNHTGGFVGVKISISDNISCNTTASYTLTNLSDREYLWTVYCTDIDNVSNSDIAMERTFILDAVPPLNITLLYPTDDFTVQSNFFDLNFSVNDTANCTFYWNFTSGEAGVWGTEGLFLSVSADTINNFNNLMAPNINIDWNVMCYDSDSEISWASSNYTFTINGSMPDCFGLDENTCDSTANCTWEGFAGGCFYDCVQFDASEGGNQSQCENAFGGELCEWFEDAEICDPVVFDKGFEGFSFCFNYDGNQTGCDEFPDDCVWFSELYCDPNDSCYDSLGSDHGWCDPTGFNFGNNFDCWTYDGNETGCFNSMDTLGWACEWNSDPW